MWITPVWMCEFLYGIEMYWKMYWSGREWEREREREALNIIEEYWNFRACFVSPVGSWNQVAKGLTNLSRQSCTWDFMGLVNSCWKVVVDNCRTTELHWLHVDIRPPGHLWLCGWSVIIFLGLTVCTHAHHMYIYLVKTPAVKPCIVYISSICPIALVQKSWVLSGL